MKRHARGDGETPGRIVATEAALRYSSVALADPANGHPVRVTRMFLDDGTKVRVSRGRLASGSVIPMPGEAMGRRTVRATGRGPADASERGRGATDESGGDGEDVLGGVRAIGGVGVGVGVVGSRGRARAEGVRC